MSIQSLIDNLEHLLINWPLFIFVIGVSIICTIAFRCIQLRYFIYSWKQILFPSKEETTKTGDMTPMQAFINTLSSNLGNGAIAGMATAIASGGPGAAFWVVFFGLLVMAARFAEVFLSVYFGAQAPIGTKVGGPMLYLRYVICGPALAYAYAVFCLWFGFISGCSIQTNSIRISLVTTFGEYLTPIFGAYVIHACAIVLFLFTVYVVAGGAARVVKISNALVPVKVILFFSTAFIILIYHAAAIIPAISLIVKSAFTPVAAIGGLLGFSVQQAIRFGMMRSIFASESGLGTAAIFFGFTGSKNPVQSALLSTLSTFLSTLVCFIVALCIIASGVWTSGLKSTDLTIAAYQTVFSGLSGGILVSFLSLTFGMGVLVSYAYLTREVWFFLTGGRFALAFSILYCLAALAGGLLDVDIVWKSSDIVMAFMLIINMLGILYLIPVIRKNVDLFMAQNK